MQDIKDIWQQRYDQDEYIYGTHPNDFLLQQAEGLAGKKVLCVAEGEGRNAVFLAKLGCHVTAVEIAPAGVDKITNLAKAEGVQVEAIQADLADWQWPCSHFDAVVAIFAHFPVATRKQIHQSIVTTLKSDGVLILEAYTPQQLKHKTGGPPKAEMMMTTHSIEEEFDGLDFQFLTELERVVVEGRGHNGLAAVVQCIAVKP
ncbi:SAM-dependent methyltransferase [Salinibius halmophilus]|uniref:SAM-dependent methyltransferase n=1 Tax=Salinibius halmophilus TaxID=1853216 RepID=UPI0018F3DE81|nr:class I SAM-dependent methyltransferase [Salinibius halmophilus]